MRWSDEEIAQAQEHMGEEAAKRMREENDRAAAEERRAARDAIAESVLNSDDARKAHPRVHRALSEGTFTLPEDIDQDTVNDLLTAKESEYEAMGVPAEPAQPSPQSAEPAEPTEPTQPKSPVSPWGEGGEGEGAPEGGGVPATPGYQGESEEQRAYSELEDLMDVEEEGQFRNGRERDRKLVMAIEQANKYPTRQDALTNIRERHEEIPPGMRINSGGPVR